MEQKKFMDISRVKFGDELTPSNTGGYHYASEIPEDTAKRNAVITWNKGEFAN